MTAQTSPASAHNGPARRRGTTGWQLAYLLGLTPWERAGAEGAPRLDRLVAGEEHDTPPQGRLLDVGCGTGMHAVRFAKRGWEVTGVDVVERAIERARARAAAEGVSATWVAGDVTDLHALVRPGFRVVLDVGCFHVLDEGRRDAFARAVDLVTEPGAALIMLAFPPRPGRRPGPRGAGADDVLRRLPGWQLEHEQTDDAPVPRALGAVSPRWFLLRRPR
jgi:SAM-dependent methyltransferase